MVSTHSKDFKSSFVMRVCKKRKSTLLTSLMILCI